MGRIRDKKLRRRIRHEAMDAIAGLTDEELVNIQHELGREMAALSRNINDLRVRLEAVRLERQSRRTATPSGIHITDHAVVRYLERVKGVDVDAARSEIGEMAARARRDRAGIHGRRIDDVTGLTIGVDETVTHVTTVFVDDELPVLALAER